MTLLFGVGLAVALLLPLLWLVGESSGSGLDHAFAAGLATCQVLLVALPAFGLWERRRRPLRAIVALAAWALIAPAGVFVAFGFV